MLHFYHFHTRSTTFCALHASLFLPFCDLCISLYGEPNLLLVAPHALWSRDPPLLCWLRDCPYCFFNFLRVYNFLGVICHLHLPTKQKTVQWRYNDNTCNETTAVKCDMLIVCWLEIVIVITNFRSLDSVLQNINKFSLNFFFGVNFFITSMEMEQHWPSS